MIRSSLKNAQFYNNPIERGPAPRGPALSSHRNSFTFYKWFLELIERGRGSSRSTILVRSIKIDWTRSHWTFTTVRGDFSPQYCVYSYSRRTTRIYYYKKGNTLRNFHPAFRRSRQFDGMNADDHWPAATAADAMAYDLSSLLSGVSAETTTSFDKNWLVGGAPDHPDCRTPAGPPNAGSAASIPRMFPPQGNKGGSSGEWCGSTFMQVSDEAIHGFVAENGLDLKAQADLLSCPSSMRYRVLAQGPIIVLPGSNASACATARIKTARQAETGMHGKGNKATYGKGGKRGCWRREEWGKMGGKKGIMPVPMFPGGKEWAGERGVPYGGRGVPYGGAKGAAHQPNYGPAEWSGAKKGWSGNPRGEEQPINLLGASAKAHSDDLLSRGSDSSICMRKMILSIFKYVVAVAHV